MDSAGEVTGQCDVKVQRNIEPGGVDVDQSEAGWKGFQ